MRRLMIFVVLVASASFAAKELTTRGGSVPLYENAKRAVNEKAVVEAGATETFIEVKRSGAMVQVRTKSGQELWAEARLLQDYSPKQGQNMDLGSGKIAGYLDNPSAVYILQEDANSLGGIQLERSFVDAIQGNMDREQTESRNGENR